MNDFFLAIGIFAFVFLVWLSNGGPTQPIAFTGPFLHSSQLSLPHSSGNNIPNQLRGGSQNTTGIKKERKQSDTHFFGTPSKYRGVVMMNRYVSGAGSTNPSHEYVVIKLANNAAPVDITGWKLESGVTGAHEVIPKGAELPHSGVVNAVEPIILTSGSRAVISSGRSPIGTSFRENICVGYFAQYQSFSPSLALICPTPLGELKRKYNGSYINDSSCVNYINKISRCSLVTTIPTGLSTACTNFAVNDLNYNGCVSIHKNDKNFESGTWRVFLERNKSMWGSQHDVVKLLDTQGKVVDTFSYQGESGVNVKNVL